MVPTPWDLFLTSVLSQGQMARGNVHFNLALVRPPYKTVAAANDNTTMPPADVSCCLCTVHTYVGCVWHKGQMLDVYQG